MSEKPHDMTSLPAAYQAPEHMPFYWAGRGDCAALLVHGFPGSPAEMRPVAEILHALGWTTEGILLPGFGPEIPDIGRYTHRDWTAAVRDGVRRLRSDHAQVAVVGNSVGAALSLAVAAQDKVDQLFLFAPFWRIKSKLLDRLFPLLQPLFPQIQPFKQADFHDEKLRSSIARFMPEADLDNPAVQTAIRKLALPVEVLAEVRAAGRAGYAAASDVYAPTVIFQGKQDVIAHPSMTVRLGQRLPRLTELRLVEGDHVLTHLDNGARLEIVGGLQDYGGMERAAAPDHPIESRHL